MLHAVGCVLFQHVVHCISPLVLLASFLPGFFFNSARGLGTHTGMIRHHRVYRLLDLAAHAEASLILLPLSPLLPCLRRPQGCISPSRRCVGLFPVAISPD